MNSSGELGHVSYGQISSKAHPLIARGRPRTSSNLLSDVASRSSSGRKPLLGQQRPIAGVISVWVFVVVPLLTLLIVPLAWGWQVSLVNAVVAFIAYVVSGFGISIGYHRYLTHRSFKTGRVMRIALVAAGALALEGPPTQWVAHHRRHHAFSDRDGDPHSPWRYGTNLMAVSKGLLFAHMGWMFRGELSNDERFAPDLLADADVQLIGRYSVAIGCLSLFLPAGLTWALTRSPVGAVSGFLWGGVWRIALLHHVTWSVNSICHVIGQRPFKTRDRAANFWPLAILSFGESWHNSHHADPTAARHGVLPGQLDPSARLIWIFEKLGLVSDVHWPSFERITARRYRTIQRPRRDIT